MLSLKPKKNLIIVLVLLDANKEQQDDDCREEGTTAPTRDLPRRSNKQRKWRSSKKSNDPRRTPQKR